MCDKKSIHMTLEDMNAINKKWMIFNAVLVGAMTIMWLILFCVILWRFIK